MERYKFLAIVSQKHYELPLITISRYRHLYYVRLLEFYNRPHNTSFVGFASSALERYNREKLYGSREFENLTDVSMNEISKNFNLKLLLQTRKLPQKRFEEYCEYMSEENGSISHVDECIGAGYEILPEYRELFFPYVLYHAPTKNLDLLTKKEKLPETAITLFHCGYKLKNYDYNNIDNYNKTVVEAKTIFQNGFKYINKQV